MSKYKSRTPGAAVGKELRELNVKPRKERGQNFVTDASVIEAIVSFGDPKAGESIVEIGPGLGALTAQLAKFTPLTLIEIEKSFCWQLELTYPKAKVINADVRSVVFSELGSSLVVFGNIPYVFSSDIILQLVKNAASVSRAILLLQREFAERVAASPGSRAYGSLSVAVQLHADCRLGPVIAGNKFHPPTKVESQVLELSFLKTPRIALPDPAWFERVVRASFSNRRKQLWNSLKAANFCKQDQLKECLAACAIDATRRAETLSIAEFAVLAEKLKQYR